jgi:hypothetical protein
MRVYLDLKIIEENMLQMFIDQVQFNKVNCFLCTRLNQIYIHMHLVILDVGM